MDRAAATAGTTAGPARRRGSRSASRDPEPSPRTARRWDRRRRARRAAFRVADLAPGQELGGVHVDPAERAELTAERLERLPVDEEHLVAVLVPVDADRPIPVLRIEVLEPGVGRLEDVAVGVHHAPRRIIRHVARAGHTGSW